MGPGPGWMVLRCGCCCCWHSKQFQQILPPLATLANAAATSSYVFFFWGSTNIWQMFSWISQILAKIFSVIFHCPHSICFCYAQTNCCLFRTAFRLICIARAARGGYGDGDGSVDFVVLFDLRTVAFALASSMLALRCIRSDRWCCCDCTFQHCFAYCAPHLPAYVVVLHASAPDEQPDAASCLLGNWSQGTARVCVCVLEHSCVCIVVVVAATLRETAALLFAFIYLMRLARSLFLAVQQLSSLQLRWANSLLYSPNYALLIRIDCRQTCTFVFSCAVSISSALLFDCYRVSAVADSFVGHLWIAPHWLGANCLDLLGKMHDLITPTAQVLIIESVNYVCTCKCMCDWEGSTKLTVVRGKLGLISSN